MNKNILNNFMRTLLMIIAGSLLLSSCISQKKLIYFQNEIESEINPEYVNDRNIDYKVQPGDNLYINISSMNATTSALFNNTASAVSNIGDISVYLNSYTVGVDGVIDFPLTGKIKVSNLTIEEIKNKLQELLGEYLKQTLIIVKLTNFNITLLGEVRQPGQYKIYQDKINIFEAISKAGDLSDFANRNKVSLIRQTKSGSKIHRLNLTQAHILGSDFFYLMPNDIIYVEPLKGKQFTFANFPYSLVFSAISTTLLLINFFK